MLPAHKYVVDCLIYFDVWTQVVLDSEWKNLATQDLWCKVRPSLSADVMMPMGRGRKDMFRWNYITHSTKITV